MAIRRANLNCCGKIDSIGSGYNGKVQKVIGRDQKFKFNQKQSKKTKYIDFL